MSFKNLNLKANELAYTLLEQTFQGTIPNPQILSYLKYSIKSELITCSSVFSALGAFKKTVSPAILNCLLLIVRNLLNSLVSQKCDDNVQQESGLSILIKTVRAQDFDKFQAYLVLINLFIILDKYEFHTYLECS